MRCFYSHRNRHECLSKRVTSVTASAASVVVSVTSVAESVTSDAESVTSVAERAAASVTSVAKTAHDCCCAQDCQCYGQDYHTDVGRWLMHSLHVTRRL